MIPPGPWWASGAPTAPYYLFDGLGSVVALTNASGSVTNSYTYDPFGVTTETKALLTNVFNPWRYTGQYQDTTTDLYKMGARYYQPELGRWTQVDPSGLGGNTYLYSNANPINFVDPSGLLGLDADAIGGAIGGALAAFGIFFPAAKITAFVADSIIDVIKTLFFSDTESPAAQIAF